LHVLSHFLGHLRQVDRAPLAWHLGFFSGEKRVSLVLLAAGLGHELTPGEVTLEPVERSRLLLSCASLRACLLERCSWSRVYLELALNALVCSECVAELAAGDVCVRVETPESVVAWVFLRLVDSLGLLESGSWSVRSEGVLLEFDGHS